MKQNIRERALNIIRQHKKDAIKEYEKANKSVFEDENYIKLEQKYNSLIIENARKEAYGEKVDLKQQEELEKKLSEMKIQKEPNFSCKKCNDEGVKNGILCTCLKAEISQILLKESGFGQLEDFDNATETCGNLKDVYALMKKWCNSDFKKNLIFLAGPTGVGKTYLLRAMANELIKQGKIVKLTTSFNINLDFRDFNKTTDFDILNKYLTCEVLFIDDLGTEPLYNNVTVENFYNIINERKVRDLPTVITSNLTLDDIRQRYGERIFSRMVERETSITLYLDGSDRRLTKKQ